MANEPNSNPNADPNADHAQGGNGGEPDYKALYEEAKANSRKWEERAKANKEKADKYDEATGGEESLEARIAKLEADKAALEQQQERRALVAKVAAEYGLSESIVAVLNGADEQTLGEQAKAIAGLRPSGAPSAPEAGSFPRDGSQGGSSDWLRDVISGKN